MRTIADQVLPAFEASGMTMTQLAEATGIERTQLHRRVYGERPFRTGGGEDELDRVCDALGIRSLRVPPRNTNQVPRRQRRRAA